MLGRLDPFRHRFDAEAAAEPDHRAHDRGALGAGRELVHERPVDLDLVEREHVQIGQRRIAGAEIVEYDRHAELLEPVQRREIVFVVLEQHRLGDLQLQARRRQAGIGERAGNDRREIALAELRRGEVDRELDVRRPMRRLGAGAADDPFAEPDDQPGFLRDRDEPVGRNDAQLRVAPPHQGLRAAHAPGREGDDGLVVQLELAARDRRAQVVLERVPRARLGFHLWLEEAEAVAAR